MNAAAATHGLSTVELKTFVPAKDYAASKRFYAELGFTLASDEDGIAYFHHGCTSFLLQNFYVREFAENLMLHLLVEDVDAWWHALDADGFAARHGVKQGALEDQPWRMRDFVLYDPSGVLWRISQNTD